MSERQDPSCINLRQRFGRQYKVRYEESYEAQHGRGARVEDPWLMVLLCRHGEICPWGGDLLAACTTRRGSVAQAIRTLPFVQVVQDGDDGINATFHVDHLEEVLSIMQPHRRRQLSAEARQAAGERLRQYQFQAAVGIASGERQAILFDSTDY